jgi:hypothetical protein
MQLERAEALPLPAGTIEAGPRRSTARRNKRTTTSWLRAKRNWLPVQIEQVEKNGRDDYDAPGAPAPRG